MHWRSSGRNELRPYMNRRRGSIHRTLSEILVTFLLFLNLARADDVFQHPLSAEQLSGSVLQQPSQLLRDAQVVRGQFVYRKYLSELPAPLESSGEYLFVKNLGIVWHTQQPFDSEFVITAKGMMQREAGKSASIGGEQAATAAARIFLSLLTLDLQTLRSTFDLYGIKAGARWQLGLRPINAGVASVLRDGVIAGGEQVETVNLHDANGDRTEIVFKNTSYSQAAPTAQDRQRFGS